MGLKNRGALNCFSVLWTQVLRYPADRGIKSHLQGLPWQSRLPLPSKAGGMGLVPGQEAKIPHALGPRNQNIKQKQYCNKYNKNFLKMVHITKDFLKREPFAENVSFANWVKPSDPSMCVGVWGGGG